tara:strand:- start:245088 stop:247370 length:2283 start_codon:yes stop_codon:yes gene_type:complete
MTLIKSNKSLVTGNKGQVALFVALIFQVLFLFFAMIVNVGLVVHHKINLQNSVDMAAYYGAMKQAELLNSIGHMNYQMRQSWKLLAWRYRMVGTAGDEDAHPYNHLAGASIRSNMDLETSNDTAANYSQPPFCVAYQPFNDKTKTANPPGENLCKKTLASDIGARVIRLFRAPVTVAGFFGFAAQTAALTQNLRASATNRCFNVGPFNYLTMGGFMFAYQLDQYARRLVIARISKSMSRNKSDFDDIDGKSVKAGAEETFKRNLTYANKEGRDLNFEMYNGLAHPGCGSDPGDTPLEYPAPWLSEIRVFPTIFYLDLNCDASATDSLKYIPKNFEVKDPVNLQTNVLNNDSMPWSYMNFKVEGMKDQLEYLAKNLYLYGDTNRFILGYEKNPWCQAYVGVKASTKPKIPFAPADLTLSAHAYAKPFGGKIGPWYYRRWAPTDKESSGDRNSRNDTNLPLRINDVATLQSDPSLQADPARIANYSKYIGDPYGLRSWRTMGQMGRAIYNLSNDPLYRNVNGTSPTDQKILTNAPVAPKFDDWYFTYQPILANTAKDILAWDDDTSKEPGMRYLEIAGIAPDQYDLAYYTIDPNYFANYYSRLLPGLIQKLSINPNYFRPDLGARIGATADLEKFSVKDQIKVVADISPTVIDFQTKLTYAVKNPVHLLTSWSNKSVFEYDKPDSEYFANCLAPQISKTNYQDPQANTQFLNAGESLPGECVTGGRTGYSVKIISKDYLFSPIKAGGDFTNEAVILNPPSDF